MCRLIIYVLVWCACILGRGVWNTHNIKPCMEKAEPPETYYIGPVVLGSVPTVHTVEWSSPHQQNDILQSIRLT